MYTQYLTQEQWNTYLSIMSLGIQPWTPPRYVIMKPTHGLSNRDRISLKSCSKSFFNNRMVGRNKLLGAFQMGSKLWDYQLGSIEIEWYATPHFAWPVGEVIVVQSFGVETQQRRHTMTKKIKKNQAKQQRRGHLPTDI